MRYSIFDFDQSNTVRLGLDIIDLAILKWFADFRGTGGMKTVIEDNNVYYWINYAYMLEDMPILNMQKVALQRRFKKLCDCGVLIHKTDKVNGTFSMYGVGIEYENILSDRHNSKVEGSTQKYEGCDSKVRGVVLESTTKDPNTKDHNTKDNARQARKQCKEESKKTYGSFDNVRLTDEEHSKLVERFGLSGTKDRIENLSLYIKSKNAKYADHNATILAWERKKEEKVPLKEEKEKAGYSDGYKFV
ncbi:MAG: hypothetical protein EOL98_13280 [Negativicutes bacterium]|nr:hypothetical protein [Negativicutes bacterium]